METVVEIKNLTKTFKNKIDKYSIKGVLFPKFSFSTAVNNVSFKINRGEAVGFLGPNGAGKTTTTKMMTGLIYPTSGEVNVLGFTPFDRKKEFLKRIGLVMGNKSGLNWDLTAKQSFELLKKIYGISDDDFEKRISALTQLLEVTKLQDKPIRKLSLGERMKMELIGAILHNPEVLFLDEPTIGLDITAKKNVRKFLKDIQQNSNITLILTSHDMDDIENVCERVIVINNGEKVYDDSLKSLTDEYKRSRFVKFVFNENNLKIKTSIFSEVVEKNEDSILYKVNNQLMPKLIAEFATNYEIADIDILSVPLEEMIEDIFKSSKEKEVPMN